jgi:N6-adenosine-specific RNA methylase IME4
MSATMTPGQIMALAVKGLAARDAVLVLWATWPMLTDGWRTFLVF